MDCNTMHPSIAHWDFTLGAVYANQTALNTETNSECYQPGFKCVADYSNQLEHIIFLQVMDWVFPLQKIRNILLWLTTNFKTGQT